MLFVYLTSVGAQQSGSPASAIAEVIYTAATDNNEQLRYAAGKDAEIILAKRQVENDVTFITDMSNQIVKIKH